MIPKRLHAEIEATIDEAQRASEQCSTALRVIDTALKDFRTKGFPIDPYTIQVTAQSVAHLVSKLERLRAFDMVRRDTGA